MLGKPKAYNKAPTKEVRKTGNRKGDKIKFVDFRLDSRQAVIFWEGRGWKSRRRGNVP